MELLGIVSVLLSELASDAYKDVCYNSSVEMLGADGKSGQITARSEEC